MDRHRSQVSSAVQGHNVSQYVTLAHLLREQGEHIPEAPALAAPGRIALTYGRLSRHLDETRQRLRTLGVLRHDRVALVLPNGVEIATAFLAVTVSATCAPLNPAYSASEFDFYLAALHVKALIVQAGVDSPVRHVARARGLRIIELEPMREAEAGLFTLAGEPQPCPGPLDVAQPDDIGLVLHTTGTAARPKIVPLTHRNLCASAAIISGALELTEHDRCLNAMPFFHGHNLKGMLLSSLFAGASVMCTPDFSSPMFFAWMAEYRPTWYSAVPTMHQTILTHAPAHRKIIADFPLRFIRSSSAFLPPRVLAELERVFNVPVIEAYGTSEASMITCNLLPPRQRKAGSGGVAVGQEVAIMDPSGSILPQGAVGEIIVRGDAVIQGYDNDPMATRDAFTHGWFRTGDEGYVDADGYLFVTGRLKELINRGGEKVAPQEVDEVLMAHPAVAEAVTFAVPHGRLGEDIAAAIVLYRGAVLHESDLRQFAAARLATFKVPQQIFFVEAIPKGPTGKLQRLRLAEKLGGGVHSQATTMRPEPATPCTPSEEVLAALWAQVLSLERVGIYDNFFQLGGDSLLATQLLLRIREATHVEISFHSFFETPTIVDIARHIATLRQTSSLPPEPILRPVPRDDPLPLSYAQQRLWFLNQWGLSRHAYHLLDAIRLRGPLQVAALEQSFQEIVRRHEILRTTFINVAGNPLQVIGPFTPLILSVIDLRNLPQDKQEAQVHARAQSEAQAPFDLANGPLLRATLLSLSDIEHVLLLTMHHIVSDGWSHEVFWRELAVLYDAFTTGQPSPLSPLSIQYADFASWQQQWLRGEVLDAQLAYWKQRLAGVSTLQLPTDHPRPPVQTFRGARYFLTLSSTLTQALKTLSQRHGVTLFMTLLAAFQTLLHRYTGQDDIAVGSLIANRSRVEVERLIGFFVNILVLRTNLSGDPRFRELLARVCDVTLGAYEYQNVPYEKLLEELRPPRDLSRNPLFQVMCVFHNTPQQALKLPDLTAEPLEIDPGTTRFDVALDFWETSEGLRGRFEYSTDLFEPASIARMAGHLQILLESIVADPEQHLSRLPLLTADERHDVVVEWNVRTTASYPDNHCIHSLFETQVAQTPDTVAVICGDESFTYRELNRRANQVAHYLRALGVGPEMLVGLYIERSLGMVVGLLGILKVGAAYLPLDPTYPLERLAFMIEDAQPPVVLTQEQLLDGLPVHGTQIVCLDTHWPMIAQYSGDNPGSRTTADNVAYLLYTSGSTGRPKGVLGVHRATLNALTWMWKAYPFASHDVCCQKTSINFGDSIQELLGPLLQGIRIVLIPEEILKDLPRFVLTLAVHHVTRIILVPSLLGALLETYSDLQDRLPSLKLWFAGGEALSRDLRQRFQESLPHRRLVNLYGASEASDDTTWYDTSSALNACACEPIGHPIANTQVYVLDPHLEPIPIGVPGELYVGGASLTRGYLNRPALTTEHFIPHPFSHESGARLYKTGDAVHYRPDGNLEYLGRLDRQVKIRGIRMELGEIEAALAQHPTVREAVVIAHEEAPGKARLVAYVVSAQEPTPAIRELRCFLELRLPAAMVPMTFVMLETLPLTPSGKVDRQALPPPNLLRPALEDVYVAPRTPIEEQVATIWCDLLGLEQVGIHDNFFELGGHSLLVMQLLFRLHDATDVEVSLASFFEAPTVGGIAAIIETADRMEPRLRAPAIAPVPREGTLLASVAQEHFWLFDQLLPGLPLFNIPYALRLVGALNVAVLEQSFNEILRRHEALRTTFMSVDGQLVQVIAPTLSMALTVRDLSVLPETEREGEAQHLLQEESQYPFDLTQGPLLRGLLLRLGEREYLLLVTLHHIISDGWSCGIVVHELAVLYNAFAAGRPSPLPVLPIQYADISHWQRQWRHDAGLEAQLTYWAEQLHEPLPVLELPTDRPRGTGLHVRTAREPLELPTNLLETLKHRSQLEGSTLFMTFLAAFKMLLYGYTGQEDVRVATLVANRTRRETEGLIGLLVNTVILRTNLGGNPTCREVLQRVRATTLAAYGHQDLPFEYLIRTLEREQNLQRASLCQVMMIWHNAMLQPRVGHTLSFDTMEQNIAAPDVALTTFDIILTLRESLQGVTGTCLYKTDLFEATTISRMLDDFLAVLTCLSAQPEQTLATFRASSLEDSRG